VDSEALIKEMQRAMVNLCNHDESQVLGTTNDTILSPPNNRLGGLLPQKLIIDILNKSKGLSIIDVLF